MDMAVVKNALMLGIAIMPHEFLSASIILLSLLSLKEVILAFLQLVSLTVNHPYHLPHCLTGTVIIFLPRK